MERQKANSLENITCSELGKQNIHAMMVYCEESFCKFENVWFHRTYVGWYRSKLKLWHNFSPAMNKHAVFKTEAIWISYQVLLCLRFIKTVLKMTSFNEPQALISFTIRRSWQCDRFLFITQPLKSKGKTSNMD